MKEYNYEVKNYKNKKEKGLMVANSKKEVIIKLKKQKMKIIKIEEKKKGIIESAKELFGNLGFKRKIGGLDIAMFCTQFGTMRRAGLDLNECLETLSENSKNKSMAKILERVNKSVENGLKLSEAFVKTKRFPKVFTSMIKVGEKGGILDEILGEMANFFNKEEEFKSEIKGAMTYPVVVIVLSFGLMGFLGVAVLPSFLNMFQEMNVDLPQSTQFLMLVVDILGDYWRIISMAILLSVIGFSQIYKNNKVRYLIDSILLKIPIIGNLIVKISVSKFGSTLSIMLSSGVDILESLNIVYKTINNKVISKIVKESAKEIAEGGSLAEPLSEKNILPTMFVKMVRVGAKTGNLEEVLKESSAFYEKESQVQMETLKSMVGPILTVVLGILIGGVILSVMMPMFNMMQSI